jgi:hypothetical protein
VCSIISLISCIFIIVLYFILLINVKLSKKEKLKNDILSEFKDSETLSSFEIKGEKNVSLGTHYMFFLILSKALWCILSIYQCIKYPFGFLYLFDKYITNGICRINGLKEFYLKYKYITCDKQKFNEEKKKFPKLILFSVGLNYTYELTYEDLFMDINNNILFLMFYDPWNPRTFKFGEKFITKYNFIYQIDQKNIGFINYNKKEEGNNNKDKREEIIESKKKMDVIWIIILSVLVVGIIIGIVVGKKIWDNKRKKRANELVDDDYEYKTGEKVEPIINE